METGSSTINMGLIFISLDGVFSFALNNVSIVDNGVVDFYDFKQSELMKNFFATFANTVENSADGTHIRMEAYIKFSKELKEKIKSFVDNNKTFVPKLNALWNNFKDWNENQFICVLPSWIDITSEHIFDIFEELRKINGIKEKRGLNKFFKPLLKNYNMYTYGIGKKTKKIGHANPNERVCRWCHKTKKDKTVSFNEKAHAISEALGNKTLILRDECDSCNHEFAKTIEQDFIMSCSLLNTFWGVEGKPKGKGKGRIPEIKAGQVEISNKGNQRIVIKVPETLLKIKNNKPATINFKLGEINVQNAYKALCKYALSLVENEKFLNNFLWTTDWISGKVTVGKTPVVKSLFTYNFFPEQPVLQIFERKSDIQDLPLMFAIFYHTNMVYLYIIPKDLEELEKYSDIKIFDEFFKRIPLSNGYEWGNNDWSNNKRQKLHITLNFKERSEE